MHTEECTASFFAPWDPDVEPYIRIATGDYPAEKRKRGRDNALAEYLCSLAHEIIHYRQWLEANRIHERGVANRAARMVGKYASMTDHA